MRNNGTTNHQNPTSQAAPSLPEEDPYGRCTNMRLTSFSESSGAGAGGPRDPRIIDLAQSTALSNGHSNGGQVGGGGHQGGGGGHHLPTSNGGNHTMPTMGQASNCHTLPAQGLAGTNPYQGGFNFFLWKTLSILKSLPGPQSSHPHNTLPARVGESPPRAAGGGGHPHQGAAGHNVHNGPHYPTHPANLQPTGRHFKPFDHRKMNPMAEIQVPV